MQLNRLSFGILLLTLLFGRVALAHCPTHSVTVERSSAFADGWQFVEDIGEEREVSRLPEVMERIAALEAGSLLEDSAPERIALQVALMDAQALLEWLESRDAGAEVPEYEWKYMEQHPHRGIQREKVRAGLEAHPGDPHLVGLMAALQDFDSTFYRAQLESALVRDPSLEHLREHLAHFLLLAEGLESAQAHIVVLLAHGSKCAGEEDSRIPWVLAVLGWLRDHPDRCPILQVQTRDQITRLFAGTSESAPGELSLTALGNRLRHSPELAESFLSGFSDRLSQVACDSRANGLD